MAKSPVPDPNGLAERPSGAQSIERAVSILRLIASCSPRGAKLIDIYKGVSLTRPTAHRILRSLVAVRLVIQSETSKQYYLGPLAFEFGLAAARKPVIMERARPILERLAELSGDTAYIVVRSGGDAVCLGRREGVFPIKALTLDVGSRSPLGVGAGGLALLAEMDETDVRDTLSLNARLNANYSGASAQNILRRIADARRNGYAVSRDIVTRGVTGVGMIVPAKDGKPTAALSISAISTRMTPKRILSLVPLLSEHCALLAKSINSL